VWSGGIHVALIAHVMVVMSRVCWGADAVEVDARVCESQARMIVQTTIDCTVALKASPDALPSAPAELRPLLSQLACTIPLKFDKAQIYGVWITTTGAKIPAIPFACHFGTEGVQLAGSVKVDCSQSGGRWGCAPTLSGVSGIGFLGRVLEAYINNSAELKSALTNALAPSAD
jgi:hypothetical protein